MRSRPNHARRPNNSSIGMSHTRNPVLSLVEYASTLAATALRTRESCELRRSRGESERSLGRLSPGRPAEAGRYGMILPGWDHIFCCWNPGDVIQNMSRPRWVLV
jgi:hypothetical protein